MNEHQELKEYLDRQFCKEDERLKAIRIQSDLKILPNIHISPYVGQFLYLLAQIHQPKKIVEIGTLGGYSSLWLSQAMPQAKIISLEINPQHAKAAQENVAHTNNIEIRVGHGVELLAQMALNNEGPFDFFFLDADKENNILYLDWAIHLSHPGTLIIIDNIIPKGPKGGVPGNKEAISIYAFNDYLTHHPAIDSAALTTLVRSGQDGMAIARVKGKAKG